MISTYDATSIVLAGVFVGCLFLLAALLVYWATLSDYYHGQRRNTWYTRAFGPDRELRAVDLVHSGRIPRGGDGAGRHHIAA